MRNEPGKGRERRVFLVGYSQLGRKKSTRVRVESFVKDAKEIPLHWCPA